MRGVHKIYGILCLLCPALLSAHPGHHGLRLSVVAEADGAAKGVYTSLQKAADDALTFAAGGQSVVIELQPGVYRESVAMVGQAGVNYAPIHITGKGEGAELSGAEPFGGLKIGKSGAFESDWQHEYAPHLFVEGVRVLHQEDTSDPNLAESALVNGGRTVRMLPPRHAVVTKHTVEAAARDGVLAISGLGSVEIENIRLGKTLLGGETAALRIASTPQVTLKNVTVEYADIGIWITHAQQLQLDGVTASRNALAGAKLYWNETVIINGGEFSLNGRMRESAEAYGLGLRKIKQLTVRRTQVTENRVGFLASYVSDSAAMSGIHVFANDQLGLQAISVNGLDLKGGIIAHNKGVSLLLRACRGQVRNTIVYASGGSGPLVDCESFNEIAFRDNIVASAGSAMVVHATGVTECADWAGNLFYSHASKPFLYIDERLDFTGWQSVTGGDGTSFFGEPLFVDPARYEFALKKDSPWFRRSDWGTDR